MRYYHPGTCWHKDRHGAGEGAEYFISLIHRQQEVNGLTVNSLNI